MTMLSAIYEGLIDATGTGALPDALLDSADKVAGIDEIFAYCREGRAAPFSIASSGHVGSALSRARLYTQRFHLLDPLANMGEPVGKGMRMARLAASDVQHAAYRHECYERPGFVEKVVFAKARGNRNFVLSFYRRRERGSSHVDALTELAELVFPLLNKHVEMTGDDSDQPIVARLERRLSSTYPQLTGREREVCARTLIGMTAEAIALDLKVSETTVLTYRRRAYERYNLSSSQEMIGRILF
jgi:DNA-binding CsgD family transcriptional regulator